MDQLIEWKKKIAIGGKQHAGIFTGGGSYQWRQRKKTTEKKNENITPIITRHNTQRRCIYFCIASTKYKKRLLQENRSKANKDTFLMVFHSIIK